MHDWGVLFAKTDRASGNITDCPCVWLITKCDYIMIFSCSQLHSMIHIHKITDCTTCAWLIYTKCDYIIILSCSQLNSMTHIYITCKITDCTCAWLIYTKCDYILYYDFLMLTIKIQWNIYITILVQMTDQDTYIYLVLNITWLFQLSTQSFPQIMSYFTASVWARLTARVD